MKDDIKKKIKDLYENLLNNDLQKKIMNHIIDGKEPKEIIESLLEDKGEGKGND